MTKTKIFVVHGRNNTIRDSIFSFLKTIHLEPIEWNEAINFTGKASPYIGEILDSAFEVAQAILVLLTPDDIVKLKEEFLKPNDLPIEEQFTGQSRPNVLFEAGLAFGRHPDRTIIVEIGKLKPFSDITGRHVIRLDNTKEKRKDLAMRLETSGCKIDFSDSEWLTVGNFEIKESIYEKEEIKTVTFDPSFKLIDSFPINNKKISKRDISKIFLKFNRPIVRNSSIYIGNYYIQSNNFCQWNINGWIQFEEDDTKLCWHPNKQEVQNKERYSALKFDYPRFEIHIGREAQDWKLKDINGNQFPHTVINVYM